MTPVPYKQTQNFTKTLVVGHPLSDQEAVVKLLNASGMSLAKPLQQQNIIPTEISKILSQEYMPVDATIEQLNVDKVWDGLALDLLMSNRDEKWWGWSDSAALPLLNYWKSLDSKMGFILVYDTPENFIKKALSSTHTDTKTMQDAIAEWCHYNEALLKFYYRNEEASLLVNAQQVKLKSEEYLQEVGKQIGLRETDINSHAIVSVQNSFENIQEDPLFSYLSDALLSEHPKLTNLYAELQSIANVPLSHTETASVKPLEALFSLHHTTQQVSTLSSELEVAKEAFENTKKQEQALMTEKEKLSALQQQATTENSELLSQLMSVQEELEKYYLVSQKSASRLKTLEKELEEKKNENVALAKEREVQSKKVQALETAQVSSKERDLQKAQSQENEELLSQLMSVQEELEKYYLENQRLKEKKKEAKRYYGAADRVKQQLSYRLGAKMIEKSHSFWGTLGLPFSLRAGLLRLQKRDESKRR